MQAKTKLTNINATEGVSDLLEVCGRLAEQQGMSSEVSDSVEAPGKKDGGLITGLIVGVAAPLIVDLLRAAAKAAFAHRKPLEDDVISIDGKDYKLVELIEE